MPTGTAYRGATAEIKASADGIFRAVRVMDGQNRQRVRRISSLEAWVSDSRVVGKPKCGEVVPETSGEGVPGMPAGVR